MANTERLNALQLVREARNAVGLARLRSGLSPEQRSDLDTMYLDLDAIEDALILKELSSRVDALVADANKLQGLAAKIEASVKELSGVAEKVGKAAKAVGALAEIAGKALSSGLL